MEQMPGYLLNQKEVKGHSNPPNPQNWKSWKDKMHKNSLPTPQKGKEDKRTLQRTNTRIREKSNGARPPWCHQLSDIRNKNSLMVC
jgi:hypothetical protein